MKAKLISILLALLVALSAAGCGAKGEANDGQPSGEERVFTDDCGREVTVPSEIVRLVPSGPLAQIAAFALAPEMFVGLAIKWNGSAMGIIADEYYHLPYFGQLYGSADLNIEELALADPQIIIDIGESKDSTAEDMDSLQAQTNIPAVFISSSLETMPETFRRLGTLLNKEEKAEKLAQFCERVYDRTVSIMNEVGGNKVNALYILGEEGLNVFANGSYHAELIDMLTNNLAVLDDPSPRGTGNQVDMEQISLWNPDFAIFASGSIYSSAADTPAWKEIAAIANGDYIEVPDVPHNWMGSPPSVQRYLGLIWLTALLYPGYCDYDVKAEIIEYYELFYGCKLTDAQYGEITANSFL